MLQRIQAIEIKKYRYTDEWRKVRGIDDVEVRGVIAQQVREVFPEWSNVNPQMHIPGMNFSLDNFHTVNKDQITVDLVAALHAQHKRFTVTANTPQQSGGKALPIASSTLVDVIIVLSAVIDTFIALIL